MHALLISLAVAAPAPLPPAAEPDRADLAKLQGCWGPVAGKLPIYEVKGGRLAVTYQVGAGTESREGRVTVGAATGTLRVEWDYSRLPARARQKLAPVSTYRYRFERGGLVIWYESVPLDSVARLRRLPRKGASPPGGR